jgi:hypothetical protein
MLLWYIRFKAYNLTPSECNAMARIALRTNREMMRNKYHPVRVGPVIVPSFKEN